MVTIDEIIQGIQIIKAQAEWDYPIDWQIVLDGAIDTMRKYQKIQEIVKNSNGLLDGTLEHNKAFVKICEVIEDDNT